MARLWCLCTFFNFWLNYCIDILLKNDRTCMTLVNAINWLSTIAETSIWSLGNRNISAKYHPKWCGCDNSSYTALSRAIPFHWRCYLKIECIFRTFFLLVALSMKNAAISCDIDIDSCLPPTAQPRNFYWIMPNYRLHCIALEHSSSALRRVRATPATGISFCKIVHCFDVNLNVICQWIAWLTH